MSSIVASADFLNYIETLGLQNHPVSKLEEGRFISNEQFYLRKQIQPIINEYLLRPALSSDFKYTNQISSVQELRNKILNSNERYIFDLYVEILDRDPSTLFIKDFDGWNYWSSVLNKGQLSRQRVREILESSTEKWVREAYRMYSDYKPFQFQIESYIRSIDENRLTKDQVITEIQNYRPIDSDSIEIDPLTRSRIDNLLLKIYLSELDFVITDRLKKYHGDRIENINNYERQQIALNQLSENLKNSNEAKIVNLFYDILRRGPSIEERARLLGELNSGTELDEIRDVIFNLKEREDNSSLPSQTSTQQIINVYKDVLNRKPDPDGLDYWVGQLDRGVSLHMIKENISNSKEAKIRNLYLTYLQREPDSTGLNNWIHALKSGRELSEIVDIFRRVDECKYNCL